MVFGHDEIAISIYIYIYIHTYEEGGREREREREIEMSILWFWSVGLRKPGLGVDGTKEGHQQEVCWGICGGVGSQQSCFVYI